MRTDCLQFSLSYVGGLIDFDLIYAGSFYPWELRGVVAEGERERERRKKTSDTLLIYTDYILMCAFFCRATAVSSTNYANFI